MDANGTRYHLLLGKPDWAACADRPRGPAAAAPPLGDIWDADPTATSFAWDCERNELTLRPNLALFAPPAGSALSPEDRRGAARDRYGNWYWIAASGTEILVNSSGSNETTHFWSATDGSECPASESDEFRFVIPPPRPVVRSLRGLAVTEDHYLVVGSVSPKGLFVFDLHSGGPPRGILWPAEVAFIPFDMAPRPCGGVWILDRVHGRYWALDRRLRPISAGQTGVPLPAPQDDFRAADSCTTFTPPVVRTCPAGFDLNAASPIDATDPIAIEALPDGTVLILDRNPGRAFSRVFRYRLAERLGEPISLKLLTNVLEPGHIPGFALTAHDFAFVPEHLDEDGAAIGDRLFVVGDGGVQAFAFAVTQADGRLELKPRPDYLPLRLFGGKALAAAGDAAYYDFADRWVPLVAQRRPRYVPEAELFTPLALLGEDSRPAFDGRDPGCVWHRLMIDACLPPEAEVRVESRAADEPSELARAPWMPEPRPHRRADGSELPFADAPRGDHNGTWELLFQRARGRFLQIKLTLSGNGRNTPRLRALRAYYPRFSYLTRYLPAVYREDGESASFLDRFLANPEGVFTAAEDKIAAVQMLFDPDSVPAAALPWLARWFELALDPNWDEARRRLVIKHAMQFFQSRGTRRGLETALRLALDECADERLFADTSCCSQRPRSVRVVEQFRTRRYAGIGEDDEGPAPPAGRWRPGHGSAVLHGMYTAFLGDASGAILELPLRTPPGQGAAWTQFCRMALGFVPSAGTEDLGRWQDFLARRYGRVSALNTAHGSNWGSFALVPLFARLPDAAGPLLDWFQFESVAVPMARAAHRFTVLIPAPRQDTPTRAEQRRRLDLARRIIGQEKPAHTAFDVQFYWAYFRVGAVRLGDDSVIDQGSRAAELHPPARLGEEYVGGSFLVAGHPQNVFDRQVLGRDRLGPGLSPEGDDA